MAQPKSNTTGQDQQQEAPDPSIVVPLETDMSRTSVTLSPPNPSWFTPKRYNLLSILFLEILRILKFMDF